jgi:pimeloyl-ACP methyl ester carboxylesterase
MPEYYVMPKEATMPETIRQIMRNEDASKTTRWLPDQDLDIYVQEWSRTGFQGGLNWYRALLDIKTNADVFLFHGKKIEVPTVFVSGKQDWGNYQQPGALEKMEENCRQFHGVKFVEGAGHWPQQEQPEKVVKEILGFLKAV